MAGVGRPSCGCAVDQALRSLSRAQFDILELLALGLTNAHIAEVRGISLKTVEMHVNKIFAGLGLQAGSMYNARVRAAVRFAEAQARAASEDARPGARQAGDSVTQGRISTPHRSLEEAAPNTVAG